jgi:hypothetical protein
MDERLEFYLKRHADAYCQDLKISHQDIATELNTKRSYFPFIKKMEQRGLVSTTSQPHRTFKLNTVYVTILRTFNIQATL